MGTYWGGGEGILQIPDVFIYMIIGYEGYEAI